MDEWKALINQGNAAFKEQRYCDAEQAYKGAKAHALEVFDTWPSATEAVSALVVSQLNIADLRCRQSRCSRAEQEIKELYAYLTEKLKTNVSLGREVPIWMGIQRAYSALLNHVNEHGVSSFEVPETQSWMSGSMALKTSALH